MFDVVVAKMDSVVEFRGEVGGADWLEFCATGGLSSGEGTSESGDVGGDSSGGDSRSSSSSGVDIVSGGSVGFCLSRLERRWLGTSGRDGIWT